MSISVEKLKKQLLLHGIRPSYQRIKILEVLLRKDTHPTADEIHRVLSPGIPTLSKATVYNTLHSFAEAGMVRVINIDDAELHYDITLSDHGHFKCEACGMIFNFDIDIDRIAIEGLDQFEIKEKNVYFVGLCPNCLNKQNHKKE